MNYFFDVGANVGQTFDDFLEKTHDYDGWEVFCFEPSARHLGGLIERVIKASGRFKVTILPFAVSDCYETSSFYEKDDRCGDSLLEHHWMDRPVTNREAPYRVMAACVSLSKFVEAHTKPEDNIVIKLDIEGSEYCVIQDLISFPYVLKRVSAIHVEFHKITPDNQDKEKELELKLMEELRRHIPSVNYWEH